ncbi:MAG: pilus assembly protein [Sphingomonas sp.]|nr:pilus assembly protein [Sphingomonas sp.]
MIRFRDILREADGAAAAEFALVLPILILFLLGTIDVGRYMWTINKVEKATQMGARMAVVTTMVPGGLAAQNYGTTLGQGATIPLGSFGEASCQKPSGTVTCSCVTTPCPTLTPIDQTATGPFNQVVQRMNFIAPMVKPDGSNVTITYKNSGLGYAGDPTGPDVAPLVTVSAVGVTFSPLVFQFFGVQMTLPTLSASLTLEDSNGSFSN